MFQKNNLYMFLSVTVVLERNKMEPRQKHRHRGSLRTLTFFEFSPTLIRSWRVKLIMFDLVDSQGRTFRCACPRTSPAAPRRWRRSTSWRPGETSRTFSRRPAPASSFSSRGTWLPFKVRCFRHIYVVCLGLLMNARRGDSLNVYLAAWRCLCVFVICSIQYIKKLGFVWVL